MLKDMWYTDTDPWLGLVGHEVEPVLAEVGLVIGLESHFDVWILERPNELVLFTSLRQLVAKRLFTKLVV